MPCRSFDGRRCQGIATPVFMVAIVALTAAPPVAAQPVTRVSVGTGGVAGNGPSGPGVATRSGSHVAFVSAASNLVPGDTNDSLDVFLRNLQTGVTTRVSVAPDGSERIGDSGAVSPGDPGLGGRLASTTNIDVDDGARFVAFTSSAPLVAGDTNTCVPPGVTASMPCPDIYLRDLVTNFTVRVSVGPGGVQANGASWHPRLTPNALALVFVSAASNLVADDTNGVADVFRWELVSGQVTLVSRNTAGVPGNGGSDRPALGGGFAWISTATNLSDVPDPVACNGGAPCERAYTYDSSRARVVRIPMPPIDTGSASNPYRVVVRSVDLSFPPGIGGIVGVQALRIPLSTGVTTSIAWIYHVQAERIFYVHAGGPDEGIDLEGTHLAIGPTTGNGTPWSVVDVRTGLEEIFTLPIEFGRPRPVLGADGTHVLFASADPLAPGDTNGLLDVYLLDRDVDGDGIPSNWEQAFGFDPATADGFLDPDGDGLTNLTEFRLGRHPRGSSIRYFAEGSANGFFATRIALVNPGTSPATAVLRYLGAYHELNRSQVVTVGAGRRATVDLAGIGAAPDFSFSTIVESDQPLVVDRTMTWDVTAYGSHAERALETPSTSWLLAEGATHGAFALFYLLQNPNPYPDIAQVTITYLRPSPAPPITRTYQVLGEQRLTIFVDQVAPELAATDVSARVASDRPILVERSMYLDAQSPIQLISAGHAGAAVSAAAPRWFLAEGATGSFFDLYYLIANPSSQDTRVRVTYLLPSGAPVVREYDVRRESRITISVDYEDPRFENTPVSAIVESLDGTGIVVERSMWWPGQGNWQEGHLAAGVTATSTRWGLAEGESGGASATQTYVLVANTASTPGTATLTLLFEDSPPESHTVALPASSRVTVPVSQFASTTNRRFGVVVDGGGLPIVVERAMYSNANGIVWAAGTAAVATPLP